MRHSAPARCAAAGRPGRRSRRVSRRSPRSDFGLRPSARCEPIERRRRPVWTGRGSRLCASAWRCRPDARPSSVTSSASSSAATWPTVRRPRSWSFAGRHAPDTPQPLDRQRMEEAELVVRRHDEEPVRLRDGARHLREELRPRDADRDREADLVEDPLAASRAAISGGGPARRSSPRTSRNASSIESPSTSGVVSSKTAKTALLASRVGGHPRRHDDRVRAEPPRLAAAHRGLDAVRLRLVAGREHDAAADDHGPPAQPRIVALLDRREERIEVGVEDGRGWAANICSHRREGSAS